jgi:membrane fusion protein, multidrug efflux system
MRSKRTAVALSTVLLVHACSTADRPATSAASSPRPTATSGAVPADGRGGGAGAAVPVVTTRVVNKPMAVTIPAVGTVEAVSTVQIRSQVTGQLTAIGFTEGDEVRKGQLLFSLDPRPFQAALDQAQAALARDTATASNQQAQQARYADLFEKGLIPRDQFEAQTAAAKASQAVLEVDKAALETARLNLQFTRITAPIAGRTGALGVHVGDLVRANDTTAMVVLNEVSPIYVSFSVPGRYLADIRRYQAEHPLVVHATPQAAALPGAQPAAPSTAAPDVPALANAAPSESGHVTFIDNAVDATTGTIKLRGSFDNRDRAFWPGLFVQVTLDLTTENNALVVPAAAVQVSQEGQYVYVVKQDRTAEMRPVNVERQQGNEMVIGKGLSAGDEVVTDGQLRLTPGARVATERGRGQPVDE